MTKRWLEVSIRATAEAAEALTAVFERAGHGVVIEPEVVQEHLEEDARPAPDAFSTLKTYLPDGSELATRRKSIEDSVGILRAFDLAPMEELRFRWVDEEDWANAWKQHYQVQRIGRRWVIKPRWQEFTPGPDDRVVELDPGMAFGTGLHPTTQLVLEALEGLAAAGEVAGRDVLDLGTGSGILAIGAAKLGARSVLALDVDDVATKAAAENAAQNHALGVVTVRQATLGSDLDGVVPVAGIDAEQSFDGVLANIVARVIADRSPAIARALRPGGWLVASGIIVDREHEARAGIDASGLRVERRDQRGDWVALTCRKG